MGAMHSVPLFPSVYSVLSLAGLGLNRENNAKTGYKLGCTPNAPSVADVDAAVAFSNSSRRYAMSDGNRWKKSMTLTSRLVPSDAYSRARLGAFMYPHTLVSNEAYASVAAFLICADVEKSRQMKRQSIARATRRRHVESKCPNARG